MTTHNLQATTDLGQGLTYTLVQHRNERTYHVVRNERGWVQVSAPIEWVDIQLAAEGLSTFWLRHCPRPQCEATADDIVPGGTYRRIMNAECATLPALKHQPVPGIIETRHVPLYMYHAPKWASLWHIEADCDARRLAER